MPQLTVVSGRPNAKEEQCLDGRTRAGIPRSRLYDVNLAVGVLEAEQERGQDGHWVVFVVDMRHRSVLRVDVVGEVLVAHLLTPQRRK